VKANFCLRFSVGVLAGAALLHWLLWEWLGAVALFLVAPYLLLAVTTWLMRTPWVLWLALSCLLLLEGCVVAVHLVSQSQAAELVAPAFGIAASGVQLPIAALVAIARYFQNAS